MEREGLEPGLLSVFRAYVVLRLVAMLAVAEFFFLRYGPWFQLIQLPYILLFLANFVFLLIYLSWPWLERKLGWIYLPIALVVAAVGPILEARYLFVFYDPAYEARFWLVFPFLAIPLILTAWQYQLRYVIGFCLATGLLEAVLIAISPARDPMEMVSDMGYLGVRTVFFVLIGYIVCHLMTEQRAQRQELDRANRRLVRYAATLEQLAISQERNRLARELHDTLAHTLSALAVQLDAIATVWAQMPPKVRTMLQRALAMTRTGLDDTRRALGALRATPLESMGLAAAVSQLAREAAARGELTLDLDVDEPTGRLVPEVEQCYYRVAQEALENAVKHAQARSLHVSLQCGEDRLLLQVADDGCGFSVERLGVGSKRADYRHPDRGYEGAYEGAYESTHRAVQFGIRGMRERADLIGATLEIESAAGQGTVVRMWGGYSADGAIGGENT
jgi:signal transduction histidine kinase